MTTRKSKPKPIALAVMYYWPAQWPESGNALPHFSCTFAFLSS